MFASYITLVTAKSFIRWLSVEKNPNESTPYAVVKVEGGKAGDKIYLMENPDAKNAQGWVPKCFYNIPENAPDTMKLPLPETNGEKNYALALQNPKGSASEQPVYSKPFSCNNQNSESVWTPTENGKFDQPAKGYPPAAGKAGEDSKAGGAKAAGAKKSASSKKSAKNSASGAVFSFAIASAVILAMLM